VPDAKNSSAAIHKYGVDSNWYTDTDATDHITGELNKLAIHDVYHGKNQIKTTSGAGMNISHIGHATASTPSRNLHLKNVLHIPNACKNLVSVHHLASDNNAFLEFHPIFFLDQGSGNKAYSSSRQGGMYPIPPDSEKQVLGAIKPSAD
jgi:histone deacetylase 1/2